MQAMNLQMTAAEAAMQAVSPLVLADRLLSLAEDAERSGLRGPAERILRLAFAVYAEKPHSASRM